MKLSILIPTVKKHTEFTHSLLTELESQITSVRGIELLIDDAENDSIGTKRNRLLQYSYGKYVAFFDADDFPSHTYIELLLKAIDSDCDCASLKGMYSVNGKDEGIFEHSIKYNAWKTTANEIKYERYPNHLNLIRSSIAKQFKFPEINHGEDENWSTQLHKSGLLKKEFYIPDIIYYYKKVTHVLAKG